MAKIVNENILSDFTNKNYKTIPRQVANYPEILEAMLKEDGNVNSWFDKNEAKEFLKIVKKTPKSKRINFLGTNFNIRPIHINLQTPDENIYPAALYDIARIELYGLQKNGKKFLDILMKTPFVLHRFGVASHWSERDMLFISSNGDTYSYPGHLINHLKETGKLHLTKTNEHSQLKEPLEKAIQEGISYYLKKDPSSYLFLHRFGEELNVNAYYHYIPKLAGYITVKEQLEDGITIPKEHKENVKILAEMENNDNKRTPYSNTFSYHREIDMRTYYILSNGEFLGFNNHRGFSNILNKHIKENLLVYIAGTQLDFGLAQRLYEDYSGKEKRDGKSYYKPKQKELLSN